MLRFINVAIQHRNEVVERNRGKMLKEISPKVDAAGILHGSDSQKPDGTDPTAFTRSYSPRSQNYNAATRQNLSSAESTKMRPASQSFRAGKNRLE